MRELNKAGGVSHITPLGMANSNDNSIDSSAKIRIGSSACVLGHKVRFDSGQAKMPEMMKQMQNDYDFHPLCPEMAAGMGTPRQTIRLVEKDAVHHAVTSKGDVDWTVALTDASEVLAKQVAQLELRGVILKSKSPSCGLSSAKVYDENNYVLEKSAGIFAAKLQEQVLVPLIEAEMLNSAVMADKFLQLVHLADEFYRLEHDLTKKALIDLWSRYKLSLMAYSPEHYRRVGKLLGDISQQDLQAVKDELYLIMFEGFNRLSQKKRQTNALMHVQGYFKKLLQPQEKQELSEIIHKYSNDKIPLSSVMMMLKHYLMLHPNAYLQQQTYLHDIREHYGLRNQL